MHRLIILSLLISLLFQLSAKEVEICPDCPIKSIKEGIGKALPGDDIIIRGGTYFEQEIIVDKVLNIKGIDFPIIDGGGLGHIRL